MQRALNNPHFLGSGLYFLTWIDFLTTHSVNQVFLQHPSLSNVRFLVCLTMLQQIGIVPPLSCFIT